MPRRQYKRHGDIGLGGDQAAAIRACDCSQLGAVGEHHTDPGQ